MDQELVDAATAEQWLKALDAAKALEPFVHPALVNALLPHQPTFGPHDAETRWLRAEKFFLERGRLAVAAVVRKAAEERTAAKAAQAAARPARKPRAAAKAAVPAEKKAALSPIASEEVRQQAQTEGLVSRPERQERE